MDAAADTLRRKRHDDKIQFHVDSVGRFRAGVAAGLDRAGAGRSSPSSSRVSEGDPLRRLAAGERCPPRGSWRASSVCHAGSSGVLCTTDRRRVSQRRGAGRHTRRRRSHSLTPARRPGRPHRAAMGHARRLDRLSPRLARRNQLSTSGLGVGPSGGCRTASARRSAMGIPAAPRNFARYRELPPQGPRRGRGRRSSCVCAGFAQGST